MKEKGISVILAVYNEKDNLPPLTEQICGVLSGLADDYEIVIVDDNSPDGTLPVGTALARDNSHIKFINRTNERGLASAVWRGVEESKFDLVVVMDADFSHPPEDIVRLLKTLKETNSDIVWASRWIAEGKMERKGLKRIQYYLSYSFNYFLKVFLAIEPMDTTNGFFITKRSNFARIKPNFVFDGYGDFSFKFAFLLRHLGSKVQEIPFTYRQRRFGQSKTRLIRVSLKYLREAFKIRWLYITKRGLLLKQQ